MRKLFFCFMVFLFIITGCSHTDNKNAAAVIKEAKLTDMERNLIQAMADQSFVLDIEMNSKNIENIIINVDYYENGEFVEKLMDTKSLVVEEEIGNPHKLVIMRQQVSDEEAWKSFVFSESGYSSFSMLRENINKEELSTVWGTLPVPAPLNVDEKKVVGAFILSNEDEVALILEDFQHLIKYEKVYVISMELEQGEGPEKVKY